MMRYVFLLVIALGLVAYLFGVRRQFDILFQRFAAHRASEAAVVTAPENPEEVLVAILTQWDFESFEKHIHPQLAKRIPHEDLRALFEASAVRLGPLKEWRGCGYTSNTEDGVLVCDAKALFMGGEAAITAKLVKDGGGVWILDLSVQAEALETVRAAAEAASDEKGWSSEVFRENIKGF
ncbi:MAG TPA: hypothetical protein VL688_02335 [Verrucomicrobiae bacterium]|jgi:hypothetical protein|nr:hypothetical protein [Verrucomicrobiae bacterium]